MSALLVSNNHLNILLLYALHKQIYITHPATQIQRVFNDIDPLSIEDIKFFSEIGRELRRQNILSLESIYSNIDELFPDGNSKMETINSYEFNPQQGFPIDDLCYLSSFILKQIRFYDYQSCEHSAYKQSWSFNFMFQLMVTAINNLPDYDDHSWGID